MNALGEGGSFTSSAGPTYHALAADVGRRLARAQLADDAARDWMHQSALDSAWRAAVPLARCEVLVRRMIDTLTGRGLAALKTTGDRLATTATMSLGSAWEKAANAGCTLTELFAELEGVQLPPPAWGPIPPRPAVPPLPARNAAPLIDGFPTSLPSGGSPPIVWPASKRPAPAINPDDPGAMIHTLPIPSGGPDLSPIATAAPVLTPPAPAPIAPYAPPAPATGPTPSYGSPATPLTIFVPPPPPGFPLPAFPPIVLPISAAPPPGPPRGRSCNAQTGPNWKIYANSVYPGNLWVLLSDQFDDAVMGPGWYEVASGPMTNPPPYSVPGYTMDALYTANDPTLCVAPPQPGPPPPTPPPGPPPVVPPPVVPPPTPPPPGPPPGPPSGLSPLVPPSFEDLTQCAFAVSQLSGLPAWITTFLSSYDWNPTQTGFATTQWISDLVRQLPLPNAVKNTLAVLLQPFDAVYQALQASLAGSGNCTPANVAPIAILSGILGIAQRWVGDVASKPKARLDRWYDFLCPDGIPSQGEADALYVKNFIDHNLWKCWTQANNNQVGPREDVLELLQNKPGVEAIIALENRGYWSQSAADDRLKYEGVKSPRNRDAFRELAKYIPGPGDLIRFMVRDVYNQNVITKYGLDIGFTRNFINQLPVMAKAHGVDQATMLSYWRAHWQIPSAHAGYTMYHRLRPGRVAPNLEFSRQDLKDMLEINDMAPFFVDRMIEINRPVIRLSDALRAYFYNVVNDQWVIDYLQDRGYSLVDAQTQQVLWAVKRTDFRKARKWFRSWIDGDITDAQAQAEATADNIPPGDFVGLTVIVDLERDKATVKACTAALKRRYMLGDINPSQLSAALIGIGHDPNFSVKAQARWTCERSNKGKVAGAAELCGWVESGLITQADYVGRLMALGYTASDANRVGAMCGAKIAAKIARLNQQAQALTRRNAERAARQAAQQAAAQARQQRSALHAGQSLEREQEKARVKLMTSAGKLAIQASIDDIAAITYLRGQVNDLVANQGYTLSGASDVLSVLTKNLVAAKETDYVTFFADYIATLPPAPVPDLQSGPPLV